MKNRKKVGRTSGSPQPSTGEPQICEDCRFFSLNSRHSGFGRIGGAGSKSTITSKSKRRNIAALVLVLLLLLVLLFRSSGGANRQPLGDDAVTARDRVPGHGGATTVSTAA
jgi:hypothetical protein